MESGRDWSELPVDLLGLILRRLQLADHIRFGAVCASWNSTVAGKHCSPAPQLPWLILPTGAGRSVDPPTIFDPFSSKVVCRNSSLKPSHNIFATASDGYVMYLDGTELNIINPLSGFPIPLPPLNTLPDNRNFADPPFPNIRTFTIPRPVHAALSQTTSTGGLVAALVYSYGDADDDHVAFARAGDLTWTFLALYRLDDFELKLHGELLYMIVFDVNGYQKIVTWDLQDDPPTSRTVMLTHDAYDEQLAGQLCDCLVVVSSTGDDMYQVIHLIKSGNFTVFKLDRSSQGADQPKWCSVRSLGDNALMVSPYRSICISTQDFPELRPNCIYSTLPIVGEIGESKINGLRVFSLADGIGEYLLQYEHEEADQDPPDWFTP